MSNIIHPTAIIEGRVELGSNNFIGPFCRISGPVEIGDNNYFDSFVSIGSPPQDDMFSLENHLSFLSGKSEFTNEDSLICIGSGNFFREFVTVHKPILTLTSIGDGNYFMTQAHVPHDALIHNRVKFANSAQLGGFSIVQSDAYLGLGSTILQFSVIGGMSMIGMNSAVSRHVFPGSLMAGSPAKTISPNFTKLNRYFGHSGWWQAVRDGVSGPETPQEFNSIVNEFNEMASMNSDRKIQFEAKRNDFRDA